MKNERKENGRRKNTHADTEAAATRCFATAEKKVNSISTTRSIQKCASKSNNEELKERKQEKKKYTC